MQPDMLYRRDGTVGMFVALILSAIPAMTAFAADLPAGFVETQIRGTWNEAVGITFAEDGTMVVWERGGYVHLNHDGHWHQVIDIHDEVGAWRDHGLLGVALHPNFLVNGYIYLSYVVDYHHLEFAGTPGYNPNANDYFSATIGRITRYTLDPATDFHTIVPGSRLILLGETKSTGIPIMFESHGVGTLLFGTDGTLLASCGDAAHFVILDAGGPSSYALQGINRGILLPKEDVGAFRSQLIDTMSGKILRLDPETGDGVPSNPYYDPLAPRSPKSRVWALGLRNPCRMTLIPETGSHNPEDADPGTLIIGDVGWGTWEEMSICNGPGQNFGWPVFEGLKLHDEYSVTEVENLDAPNPLTDEPGCDQEFFSFTDLIMQDTLDPDPFFPNPCNPAVEIPSAIPTWVHRRPEIEWRHGDGPSRTGIFVDGVAATVQIGAPSSPIAGEQFGGNCSLAGAWYSARSYPAKYRNTYFHVDYGAQWIKNIVFDENHEATLVRPFVENAGEIITVTADPVSGDLVYVAWNNIYRISYNPTGNLPPVAAPSADVSYGPGPLTVQFTGTASSDPEEGALAYSWDFGDGSPISSEANPVHQFIAPAGVPTSFTVTLTVTDDADQTDEATLLISVNNTPPVVSIVSPVEGSTYSMSQNTAYMLVADIDDAEHGPGELSCEWQTVLHHNNHTHEDPPVHDCLTSTTLSPAGCDGNVYFFRISLTVTDADGLSATDTVDVHPDCTNNTPPLASGDSANVSQNGSVQIEVLVNDSDIDGTIDPGTVAVVDLPEHGVVTLNPLTGVLTYQHDGSLTVSDSFGYTVNDDDGGTSNVATVLVAITPGLLGDINGDLVIDEADRAALCLAMGTIQGGPGFLSAADLNGDDVINHLDHAIFEGILPGCMGDLVTSATLQPPADGVVDGADLAVLIASWGSMATCADMVTSATLQPPPDGVVSGADLAVLLGAWGPCN